MTYILGFSSGFFSIAEAGEKESLMTMPRKLFKGAIEGVNFTQIDLESITEFKEPYLKEGIKRMKSLGLRFGFHGESYAMGGGEKPMGMLDSCIEADYMHSHDRLIQHIEGCGSLGGEFVNIHPSETTPYIRLGKDLQPSKLVDPWGRPLAKFLEENQKLLDWVIRTDFMWEFTRLTPDRVIKQFTQSGLENFAHMNGNRSPSKEEMKEIDQQAIENTKRYFLQEISVSELSYGAERAAYLLIAKWMQDNKDPIWKDIVGRNIADNQLDVMNREWVPAVSSKYIWGHFNPLDRADPKPLLKKHNLIFVFETQMGSAGAEGLFRLTRPRDMIFLCKSIGSDHVGVCFDTEHVLSQNIDPIKEAESIPMGMARYVKVCHLGWPTPHIPAHMPIPLGSEAQEYLYGLLFELRKRGMIDSYFIFERAGEARGTTILALRMIKHYLEKDIPPKELPLDFYGMNPKGPDNLRQEVIIREHFFDPLKGMLQFPEEEYTFLSKAAAEKGKADVWRKEQFR